MVEFAKGNLLEADVEALVNAVNTVGVMGKGLALQFRRKFPTNDLAYRAAAKQGMLTAGKMFVFDLGSVNNPHYIINFPTKRHWRDTSRLGDIEAGLVDLVDVVRERQIASVAVPALGCGLGGLS